MIAWTIYLTFGGGVLVLVLPRAFARWVALFATIAGLALGAVVFVGTPIPDLAHFTTIVRVPWVPALGMNYHLALDGISLTMVIVTGISAVSTVLFSWDVEHRQNEFFFWLLLVLAGCYGGFDVARGNCDEARLLRRSARCDESFSAGISDVEQMDRCAGRDRNRVCRGSGASPT